MKITVYQINDKYFLPVGPASVEIEYSKLMTMQQQGTEVEVIRGEYYV
ncbi:hypothetical protein [Cytobacillus oceanisediminis]